MKVLLIRPKPDSETIGLQHVMIVEPLELEILATLIEKEHQPVIIDLIIEKRELIYFINSENPDVVCFTGYITNVPAIITYCKTIKNINPRIKTVVGGVHCEVCPEDFKNDAVDFRVVRNATTVFSALLGYICGRGEKPKEVLEKDETVDWHNLPTFNFHFPAPNRRHTNKYRKHYFYIFHNRVALIKTAFGCKHRCRFCFCRKITAGNYSERPLVDVIKELQNIKEKEIYIVDDNFLSSRQRVINFIDQCIAFNIKKSYLIYGRADFIAKNEDVIKYFKKIGLRTIIVGIESFKESDLRALGKKTNARIQKQAIAVLKRNQIDCYATMIASPDWSKSDFKKLRKELVGLGIHYLNLQPLTPLPGTDIEVPYDKIIIDRSQYVKWDLAHVSIKPAKMSIYEYYSEILKTYYKVLYQPKVLLRYLLHFSPHQLYTMGRGSMKVYKQYRKKQKEAKDIA